jgi:peptidoglycan/xylan/chitin deacetylase (PgdA/CDA1 family)
VERRKANPNCSGQAAEASDRTERSLALALRLARSAIRRARDLLPRRPAPSILLYHRIAEGSFDPWGLAVAPHRFEAQVQWLARNRNILPLTKFAQLHREGRLPADAVAITFDDGYASVLEVAAPILSHAGAPATVFLSAELIERGAEFWWDELQNIALGFHASSLRLGDEQVPLGARSDGDLRWPAGAPARTARQRAFLQLWTRLKAMSPSQLDAAMTELSQQAGVKRQPESSRRAITAAEAQAGRWSSIQFGSHAVTHASLPALEARERQREIR